MYGLKDHTTKEQGGREGMLFWLPLVTQPLLPILIMYKTLLATQNSFLAVTAKKKTKKNIYTKKTYKRHNLSYILNIVLSIFHSVSLKYMTKRGKCWCS